jgi:hypothetical protein
MNNRSFAYFLPVLVVGMILNVSCKKEDKTKINVDRSIVAGGPSGAAGTCGDSTISGVINSNLHLKSCKIYKLDGLVYVANNAAVTIEAGTLIKGMKGIPAGGLETAGGTLIVTRGSKLNAVGNVANPIIFTSNEPVPASGDWGGVVLIGKAPTNYGAPLSIEGIIPGSAPVDITYGGPGNLNFADNSGILKYVRIEYAGFELTVDNELNGLSLYGVGNGTTLDYIEVYKAKADAFSFAGGTVNASHLLAIDALDDMFYTNYGYTGTISFGLGIADPTRSSKNQSNGIESENNVNGAPNVPFTHPVYNNITIIGVPNATVASNMNGLPSGNGKYGRGAYLRRNTQFTINRSIFIGFNYGISQDIALPVVEPPNNTYTKYLAGISILNTNYVHGYIYAYDKEVNSSGFTAIVPLGTTNKAYVNANPNFDVKLRFPFITPRAIINYIPNPISPAQIAGAFPIGNTTWADSWTVL